MCGTDSWRTDSWRTDSRGNSIQKTLAGCFAKCKIPLDKMGTLFSHDPAGQFRAMKDLVPLEDLSSSLLQSAIDPNGSIRQIVIGIGNKTNVEWQGLNVYFVSGTSDAILPEVVSHGKAGIYSARKILGPFATGAVGVASFYIKEEDKTLCVLFSVPFNGTLYNHFWNAKIYADKKYADQEIYQDLYYENTPIKGDNCYYDKDIGKGYKVKGYMTSSEKSNLLINIEKEV